MLHSNKKWIILLFSAFMVVICAGVFLFILLEDRSAAVDVGKNQIAEEKRDGKDKDGQQFTSAESNKASAPAIFSDSLKNISEGVPVSQRNESNASPLEDDAFQIPPSEYVYPNPSNESDAALLNQLRSSSVFQATKLLNPNIDFTNPDDYGVTKCRCIYNPESSSANGFETKNGKPDYEAIYQKGICCAGFINYYLWNYLPKEEGKRVSFGLICPPINTDTDEWGKKASEISVNTVDYSLLKGGADCIFSVKELVIGNDYREECECAFKEGKYNYEIGDILIFSDEVYRWAHIAIYAGYYNGQHWIAHATDRPKKIGVTLTPFTGYSLDRRQFQGETSQIIHVEYVTRVWRVSLS